MVRHEISIVESLRELILDLSEPLHLPRSSRCLLLMLSQGSSIALVTWIGFPAISDKKNHLIWSTRSRTSISRASKNNFKFYWTTKSFLLLHVLAHCRRSYSTFWGLEKVLTWIKFIFCCFWQNFNKWNFTVTWFIVTSFLNNPQFWTKINFQSKKAERHVSKFHDLLHCAKKISSAENCLSVHHVWCKRFRGRVWCMAVEQRNSILFVDRTVRNALGSFCFCLSAHETEGKITFLAPRREIKLFVYISLDLLFQSCARCRTQLFWWGWLKGE